MSGSPDPDRDVELRQQLEVIQQQLGDATAELTMAREELAAAHLDRGEWDRLSAELTEQLRQSRERLDAIETSRTWVLAQRLLAPYRAVRALRAR